MQVEAKYYDGKSSKEHLVTIEFSEDRRCIIKDFDIDLPLSELKITSRLGNTPRLIELPNGARCKVANNDKLDRILQALGMLDNRAHKLERSWKLALASIVFIALFITFMLTAGASYSAALIANVMPKGTLDSVSKTTLEQIEKRYLHKSNLSKEKKEHIKKLFAKLTDNNPRYKLHFRSSPMMGPNAFALPSGDIVLLDELVFLDKDKELRGVLGVLAHEKGHVVHRHALKGAIKGTIATAVIGYFTGDASFIATTLPTLLINTKYSREFEHEADMYAKSELKRLHTSSKPLANLFRKLENYSPIKEKAKDKNRTKKSKRFDIPTWISTHPSTIDRVKYFEQE